MRVRIIVNGEDLGDVEVDHGDSRLVRHIGENPRDIVREVLDKAVAQVEDAYGIRRTESSFVGVPDTRQRGGGSVGAKEPDGSYLINAAETTCPGGC
jgi:hypothetical protein